MGLITRQSDIAERAFAHFRKLAPILQAATPLTNQGQKATVLSSERSVADPLQRAHVFAPFCFVLLFQTFISNSAPTNDDAD
jgi:hypothetical protein